MNVKGKIVTLRAIEENDMDLLKDMINDPEIEDTVVGWSFPISSYEQREWYQRNISNKNNIRLIIDSNEFGPIGLVTILNIDWKNRVASHGIKIVSKKYRNMGIGKDALMASMKYMFEELQFHRLEATILEYNSASLSLYSGKCNWKIEGVKRKCTFKLGKYHDRKMLSILKEEYEELIKSTDYWNK